MLLLRRARSPPDPCQDPPFALTAALATRCSAGKIVLSDRYFYTSLARDVVRGNNREWLSKLYSTMIKPDLAMYFRIPVETAISRVVKRRVSTSAKDEVNDSDDEPDEAYVSDDDGGQSDLSALIASARRLAAAEWAEERFRSDAGGDGDDAGNNSSTGSTGASQPRRDHDAESAGSSNDEPEDKDKAETVLASSDDQSAPQLSFYEAGLDLHLNEDPFKVRSLCT